jgi:hypothetical protein
MSIERGKITVSIIEIVKLQFELLFIAHTFDFSYYQVELKANCILYNKKIF